MQILILAPIPHMNRTSMKKPTVGAVGFFVSAALFYIPYLLFFLDHCTASTEIRLATRIIAIDSRRCKDFFRFPVDKIRLENGDYWNFDNSNC